jgi:hypothetical protein
LSAPEGVARIPVAAGSLDAAQAAPAFAFSGRKEAHLVAGVMSPAAIAKNHVGHLSLLPLINLRKGENAVAWLQDDDACGQLAKMADL